MLNCEEPHYVTELIERSRNAWQEAASLTALSEDHRVHGQMLIKIGSERV
jgi:hypothetical protein